MGCLFALVFGGILLSFFVAPFLMFFGVLAYIFGWYKRANKISDDERKESLMEGGVEEPNAIRELTVIEKEKLKSLYKHNSLINTLFFVLLPLFILVDIYIILHLPDLVRELYSKPAYASIGDKYVLPFFAAFFGIPIQLFIIQYAFKGSDVYLDLRSPVFRVQGKAKINSVRNSLDDSHDFNVKVRGLYFGVKNGQIKEEDEVAVEYSPRTKHVWKIYKTEDI